MEANEGVLENTANANNAAGNNRKIQPINDRILYKTTGMWTDCGQETNTMSPLTSIKVGRRLKLVISFSRCAREMLKAVAGLVNMV